MKTLEQQLRRYGEIVDDVQSRVSLDEALSDSKVTTLSPVAAQPRSWVWALGAFVLVGVLGLLVWSLTPSESPTVTQPTTETTVVSDQSPSTSTPESSGPRLVESTYVGSETSLGTLTWTLVEGGMNSCPPHIRETEDGTGYYSLWCKGGVMTSGDGYDWTLSTNYPTYEDNPEFHYPPPKGNTLPPTTPVAIGSDIVSYSETKFGWVASLLEGDSPRMWVSADGQTWEEVETPPGPDADRSVWPGRGGGAGDLLYWGYVTRPQTEIYLWVGHFDGRPVESSTATTTQPQTTTTLAKTTATPGADASGDSMTIEVADELGESVTFNGRTFRISTGSPYQIEELSDADTWVERDEFQYDFIPTITTTESQILSVSPMPGQGERTCREYILFVAVSTTGEDWDHAAIDDLGDDIRQQEARPDRRHHPCMNIYGGGDAIGPAGILIVRVITRCCIDPYNYPHFWFSPDGRRWQRVELPAGMMDLGIDEWGPPRATSDGFAIDVTYYDGDPDRFFAPPQRTTTWQSSDGLNWKPAQEKE